MWFWKGWPRPSVWGGVCVGVLVAVAAGGAFERAAAAYAPTGDERSLQTLVNQARAEKNLAPVVWHDGLGQAARAHSEDMAQNGCRQHDSCNGESWSKRIGRYYPSWSALGETVGGDFGVRGLFDAWMASTPHRNIILNPTYSEFGSGLASQRTDFGTWTLGTQDFGSRGGGSTIPALPSGGVVPRIGGAEQRELIVNYYDKSGSAAKAVRALVGPSCVDLALQGGKASNGTYGVKRSFTGSGCVPVVFEAIRGDGTRHRWPASGAMLVGVGGGGQVCAELTPTAPSQDCGGGGGPVPTPTPTPGPNPTPTPGGGSGTLSALRIVLKPGPVNASKGQVQVQATLPAIAGFDPTSAPVQLRLAYGLSGDWATTLAQLCGGKPCLKANKGATSYNAKYAEGTTLNVVRQGQKWRLRYSGRNQTLSGVSPGEVDLTVVIGGRTYVGTADGELKESGLIAD